MEDGIFVLVQPESFLDQGPHQLKLLLVNVLVRCDLEPFDVGVEASFQASFCCCYCLSLRDIGCSGTDPRLRKVGPFKLLGHLADTLGARTYISLVLCESKSFASSGAHLC